ncbi:unnamed protein product [Urochloa decumbens]|uniref:DUF1618 domain-containing protein n=1 Tax=Urochloa decumbens TaxID=240449 RepID=A0ABC8W9B7_9POAL
MDDYVPSLDPPFLPTEDGDRLNPSSVLLDTTAYISAAAVSNATTAKGEMSTGAPIQISFCLARPPRLSYLCAHFPGPVLGPGVGTVFGPAPGTPAARCVRDPPLVISTHADLALLRVNIPGSLCVNTHDAFDYLVYNARPRPGASSLDLLPKPTGFPRFRDQDAAVVRCSGSRYVIAVLRTTRNPLEFQLQLYDSDTRRWTSTPLTLQAPERDKVLHIPEDSDAEPLFHNTTKVITLESTTVGWVDLWRGILFCDVLDEKPVLRDMPLPKPARCNRASFCRRSPYGHRDITVVTLPDDQPTIKYVEMGIRPGAVPSSRRRQVHHQYSSSESDDNDEDDAEHYWTATIWSMPVPIASWKDWTKDCTIDVANIVIDNPRHCELLRNVDPEEASPSVTLNRLLTAYPTLGLGINGEVVIYFLSKVDQMAREGWVIAVGAKESKLQGIAKLDDRKNFSFRRYYCPTEISKYLTKATGEAGRLMRLLRGRK